MDKSLEKERRNKNTAYQREYRRKHREKIREYNRMYNRAWRLSREWHKQKAAYLLLHGAIANGTIKRQVCEICGSINTHGHHFDYDKPLSVLWLCPRHHAMAHYRRDIFIEVLVAKRMMGK